MNKCWFYCIVFFFSALECAYAQFPYGTTGLLHVPTADMQRDKTLMFGTSILNKHATPGWNYNTYNYYINITIFPFLEVAYTCTLNKGEKGTYWPQSTWGKFTNQDRQFSARLRIFKESLYMPAVLLGVNDMLTRDWQGTDKVDNSGFGSPIAQGNGRWNRYYLAITKHFNVQGDLGVHVAYVYNRREKYSLNGPALGVSWASSLYKKLNFIAEYDSRTVNCGLRYAFWKDHINLIGELNHFKYISAGMIFKVYLK